MLQFGGKPTKTSSDSKRHFTVVMGGKEYGLYVSSTPSSAARKVVTKLCTANKSKKVEFSIREITQGSKKKTYGPYVGHIEKLKEPIELKGRVIKYKPIAKLCAKKSVQKGGNEFYYKRDSNDKIYKAIQKKLEDDQNFLTAKEKDKLGFNDPIQSSFFTNATTYFWELYPVDFQDFTNYHLAEDPKYFFGILRIKQKSFLSSQSIYIAFRVNLSKIIIIRGVVHHPETIIELIFLAKGVGLEEFLKNLVKDTSYSPNSQEYRNRSKNINELIELIKKENIESVVRRYDEFKRLYNRLKKLSGTEVMNYQGLSASVPFFKNHGLPVSASLHYNQGFPASASTPKNKGFPASEPLSKNHTPPQVHPPPNNQRFLASVLPFSNQGNKKDIRISFITTGVDLNFKIHNQIKEILDLIFHKYNTEKMRGNGLHMILFRGFTNLKKNKIEEYI